MYTKQDAFTVIFVFTNKSACTLISLTVLFLTVQDKYYVTTMTQPNY